MFLGFSFLTRSTHPCWRCPSSRARRPTAWTEAFGWRSGLDRKLTRAPQFYAVIVAATLVGMAIEFLGINPITALVVSAVVNGLVAAPLLVLVMLPSNNRKAMGARTNGHLLSVVSWVTTIVMGVAAAGSS